MSAGPPSLTVPRSAAGTSTVATVGVAIEERHIFVAQGVQFRDADLPQEMKIPGFLAMDPASRPDIVPTVPASARGHERQLWLNYQASQRRRARTFSRMRQISFTRDGTDYVYTNTDQNVRFRLSIITTKSAYKAALETPDAHIVYAGHARYGRGPCFGAEGANPDRGIGRGDQWENGTGPAATSNDGIFRIGYPYLAVPISSIMNHGYTAPLVESSVRLAPADCEPDLRRNLSRLQSKLITDLPYYIDADGVTVKPRATSTTTTHNDLNLHCVDHDATKHYWAYQGSEDGASQWFVVLRAGWTGTVNSPMDLGATNLRCKVFCHFGCDTFKHNQKVLRDLKAWRQSGDSNYAYFTTNIAHNITAVYWLYHVMTYTHANANAPWGPSLAYALQKTNEFLSADGETFRIT